MSRREAIHIRIDTDMSECLAGETKNDGAVCFV